MAMSANRESCNSMAMGLADGNIIKQGICNSMAMELSDGNVSKQVDLQ